MYSIDQPLRYQISDWHQLTGCISNTAGPSLRIRVADFIIDQYNDMISGTRIEVHHDSFGTLFACIVDGGGRMMNIRDGDYAPFELSPDQILSELEKYGFFVTYDKRANLSGDQLSFLMTISSLHFDKLRILKVRCFDRKTSQSYIENHIVVFKIKQNPLWIDNAFTEEQSNFIRSLKEGSAMDISTISESRKYDWSWLDYVANISDILKDNAS